MLNRIKRIFKRSHDPVQDDDFVSCSDDYTDVIVTKPTDNQIDTTSTEVTSSHLSPEYIAKLDEAIAFAEEVNQTNPQYQFSDEQLRNIASKLSDLSRNSTTPSGLQDLPNRKEILKNWANRCLKVEADRQNISIDDLIRSLCVQLGVYTYVLRFLLYEKNPDLDPILFLNLAFIISKYNNDINFPTQEIRATEILAEEITVKKEEEKRQKRKDNSLSEKRFSNSKYYVQQILNYSDYVESLKPIDRTAYIYVKPDNHGKLDKYRDFEKEWDKLQMRRRRHSFHIMRFHYKF